MNALPLLVVILGQFGVLVYLASQYGKDRAHLLNGMLDDRSAYYAQINELLQRIQAPEAAVAQHQVAAYANRPEPQALPLDDDEAFHAFKTKEQLAAELL